MAVITTLGICGSPRKGNSLFLLEKAIEGAMEVEPQLEVETYTFKGKSFHPCTACSHCADHEGECVHHDDFEELRSLWLKADVILYSVPVYHMGIPGQLKCFLDRLGNSMFGLYRKRLPPGKDTLPKLLKIVGSIAQGMHMVSGQEHTLTDLINHTLIMQCIPVPADLWESYIGTGGWTANLPGRKDFQALYERGDLDAGVCVRAARSLGRRAVELAAIVRAGVSAYRDHLREDPMYGPLLSHLDGGQ